MDNRIENNSEIFFTPFRIEHIDKLIFYFENLSQESKKRFGPHPFTKESIGQLFGNSEKYKLYVAINNSDNSIIAYTIIQSGWVEFDAARLKSYGLSPINGDFTLAPSVTDLWQSRGVGGNFLKYVLNELRSGSKSKRIFLWGGVQCENYKALGMYKKFGFTLLGEFEHNGGNFDMVLEL